MAKQNTVVKAMAFGLTHARAHSGCSGADKFAFAAAFAVHSFPEFRAELDAAVGAVSRVHELNVNPAAAKLSDACACAVVASGKLVGKSGQDLDEALAECLAA